MKEGGILKGSPRYQRNIWNPLKGGYLKEIQETVSKMHSDKHSKL